MAAKADRYAGFDPEARAQVLHVNIIQAKKISLEGKGRVAPAEIIVDHSMG